jgi:myo-inositol-1(or 4)-monophosphatase
MDDERTPPGVEAATPALAPDAAAALAERHAFAVALAVEAGALALSMRTALGPAEAKSPIDFCTEADRAVERLIQARIAARFGDAVIGEEYGGAPADGTWVVDPIDGTTEYIHGTNRWCVSMAYVLRGTVELGVTYSPPTDRLFSARRGVGATLNGRAMRVSGLAHGTAPLVEVGWSGRRPIESYAALLVRLNRRDYEFRRHGSGALALAEVACGLSDGYVEEHMNAWDALAGLLLVTESGGRCAEYLAGDGLLRGNRVVAATPEIFHALLEAAVG